MNENYSPPQFTDAHATQLIMKLFENSKEHVEEIVDNLPLVYAVISDDGEIIRGNREMGVLFDAPFEHLIGENLNAIFHARDWPLFSGRLQETATSGKKNELNLPAGRGGKTPLFSWTLVRLNRVTSRTLIAVIGKDITVAERSAGLTSLLNSLDEGYCVADMSGRCLSVSSRRMREFHGADPIGQELVDVLEVPRADRQTFNDWLALVRSERLPFAQLADLCPIKWWSPSGQDRKIEIRFHPVRGDEGRAAAIAVVATDRTEELRARETAARETEKSFMILRIIEDLPGFLECWNGVSEFIDDFEKRTTDRENTIRLAHTLKSSFTHFGWETMATSLDAFERECQTASDELLAHWRKTLDEVRTSFAMEFPQVLDVLFRINKNLNPSS